jgi:NAD(P)H-hydrate epimerase
MPGAVCLAAEAALRVGAGKVTIVTREKHFAIVMAKRSEFICVTVEEDFSALEHVLNTADVCVVGPGMMLSNWSREVFQRCLQFSGPKVLDAGALALLSETPQFITQAILTPHPGEAAKLLSVPIAEVEANRYQKVAMLAHAYADIVILKGAGTLIFASNDFSVHVCGLGNAGMATAGMGDVLAGMVGGLANQYQGLKKAALAGVLLHSHAGDLAAKALGEQALLAGDLVNHFQWAN